MQASIFFTKPSIGMQEEKDITAEDIDLVHQQLLDAVQVTTLQKCAVVPRRARI